MVMRHAAERVGVAEVQEDARHAHGALAVDPREDVFGRIALTSSNATIGLSMRLILRSARSWWSYPFDISPRRFTTRVSLPWLSLQNHRCKLSLLTVSHFCFTATGLGPFIPLVSPDLMHCLAIMMALSLLPNFWQSLPTQGIILLPLLLPFRTTSAPLTSIRYQMAGSHFTLRSQNAPKPLPPTGLTTPSSTAPSRLQQRSGPPISYMPASAHLGLPHPNPSSPSAPGCGGQRPLPCHPDVSHVRVSLTWLSLQNLRCKFSLPNVSRTCHCRWLGTL